MKLRKLVIWMGMGVGLMVWNLGHSQRNASGHVDEVEKQKLIEAKKAEIAARQQEQMKDLPEEAKQKFYRFQSALTSATYELDGEKSPDAVPYNIKMLMFFTQYHNSESVRQIFVAKLTPADIAVLDGFKEPEKAAMSENMARERRQRQELGDRAEKENMNAVAIAAASKQNIERGWAADTARYKAVIGRLSSEGQKFVNQWVQENIRPKIQLIDEGALARAEPEIYKEQFVARGKFEKSGAAAVKATELPTSPIMVSPKKGNLMITSDESEQEDVRGGEAEVNSNPPE